MVQRQSTHSVSVIWRGKKFLPEVNSEATVLDLGEELQKLTDVKADTIRLIVPQSSSKSSLMLSPFSDEHSCIRLQDTGIFNGRPLRMMGVLDNEVDQLLNDSKVNLRIPGFEEEEKRMKERLSRGPRHSLKLPEGPYVFCGFRTLEIPGVELNPPPLEALKRMHMLAADPGIVAIMNKHRWRVGIMTEMAPIGYVGVSPMCLLGLNKNQGEEISLRLRTDDLKGFRKYESIKKTLLHELAHMVWSEHDENFYALDKLLNQEAFALDWTRSRSHTLADTRFLGHDDFDMDFELESSLPRKLGGETSVMPASARFAAVAAAYHRLAESSTIPSGPSAPKTDDSSNKDKLEPDPDDSEARKIMILEPESEVSEGITNTHQPNCGDTEMVVVLGANMQEESDPDDSDIREHEMPDEARSINSQSMPIENNAKTVVRTSEEPDPDDAVAITTGKNTVVSDTINGEEGNHSHNMWQTPDSSVIGAMTYEPDPDDEELKRVHDPVTMFCDRLTKAIEMLRNELNPSEVVVVQQTLFKIIGNVSENPNEMKYKRLRKANPLFQRSVANCKAALEVLFVVGFVEEVVTDQTGKAETYLVLKRNDPGLLWLAKSFLETISAKS